MRPTISSGFFILAFGNIFHTLCMCEAIVQAPSSNQIFIIMHEGNCFQLTFFSFNIDILLIRGNGDRVIYLLISSIYLSV